MNSLGFDKPVADTRVVVAMSGGVDSSVVAAMLREEGYDVVGITLQLYDHGAAIGKKGACCAGKDIEDARQVANALGFPHYVLNYENIFRQEVMEDFADTYLMGQTPIPCVKCNQSVKFRDLCKAAKDIGADALATGHYVQRVMGANGAEMHRGVDPSRDQSYFLFATTQEQLDYLRFPLGGMEKTETRKLAAKYGLIVQDKPDSQDICFVPNGNYAEVVQKLRPHAADPGEIIHVNGQIVGKHEGIIHYTVGQRRGLGIAWEEPLYVVKLDADKKQVIVGPKEALLQQQVRVRDFHWLDQTAPVKGRELSVKLRSAQPLLPASFDTLDGKSASIMLNQPQEAIAPGQACVMYDGNRVLGGGWISAV